MAKKVPINESNDLSRDEFADNLKTQPNDDWLKSNQLSVTAKGQNTENELSKIKNKVFLAFKFI